MPLGFDIHFGELWSRLWSKMWIDLSTLFFQHIELPPSPPPPRVQSPNITMSHIHQWPWCYFCQLWHWWWELGWDGAIINPHLDHFLHKTTPSTTAIIDTNPHNHISNPPLMRQQPPPISNPHTNHNHTTTSISPPLKSPTPLTHFHHFIYRLSPPELH